MEDFGSHTESARLRSLWGRFLLRHGEDFRRQALFDESLRILPGNHLALSLKGEMEMKRGHFALAQKYLMEAFTASKQLRYLIHYARAKALAGDTKTAAGKSQDNGGNFRAKRFADGELRPPARARLNSYWTTGDAESARKAVSTAREELKIRRSAEANYLLAKSLLAEGKPQEAAEPIRESYVPE